MKALDLFCGLGGWSDGLAAEGFNVLGVEVNPKIAELYKHPVIVKDVRKLHGYNFKGYDLIVGSPPCRDFTQIPDVRYKAGDGYKITSWKRPKNPQVGLKLVFTFLSFIDRARPRYWLMENVVGLEKYLKIKPVCRVRFRKGMKRSLWGCFPPFLVPQDNRVKLHVIQGQLRKWDRAKIPFSVSRALGRAIKNENKNVTLNKWVF